ncbi:MAG: hypothetical protein RBQ91_05615 [Acholeplasma sp.]|jgi:nitrogen fixation/metabolism regulation signal transduction histidine kinase|nr:hypothetical protein [Acholeplasma sp.]
MDHIIDFIVYALRCVMLLFLAMFGQGEVSENWLQDTIVGVVTLIILILIVVLVDRKVFKFIMNGRKKNINKE